MQKIINRVLTVAFCVLHVCAPVLRAAEESVAQHLAAVDTKISEYSKVPRKQRDTVVIKQLRKQRNQLRHALWRQEGKSTFTIFLRTHYPKILLTLAAIAAGVVGGFALKKQCDRMDNNHAHKKKTIAQVVSLFRKYRNELVASRYADLESKSVVSKDLTQREREVLGANQYLERREGDMFIRDSESVRVVPPEHARRDSVPVHKMTPVQKVFSHVTAFTRSKGLFENHVDYDREVGDGLVGFAQFCEEGMTDSILGNELNIEKDIDRAIYFYIKAAEKGHRKAQEWVIDRIRQERSGKVERTNILRRLALSSVDSISAKGGGVFGRFKRPRNKRFWIKHVGPYEASKLFGWAGRYLENNDGNKDRAQYAYLMAESLVPPVASNDVSAGSGSRDPVLSWYRELADGDYFTADRDAQVFMGHMYARGNRVAQDDKKAVEWYLKAAKNGNKEARAALNAMANGWLWGIGGSQEAKDAVAKLGMCRE